jgi:PAS domain S-box-containing protein
MGELALGRIGELESEMEEILDRISDGFVSFDRGWRFVHVNRAAEHYFGVPRSKMLGKVCWEFFPEDVRGEVVEAYLKAAASAKAVELELFLSAKNCWVQQTIYPSPGGATVYLRNVSAERRMADALSAKQVRETALSKVSHDLRNSLNAIGFIASELARQNGSPLATQIRSAATLADRQLADLGAMFVIESGALVLGRVMESIDSIMDEVADLFRPLAEARAVRLRAVTEKKGLTAFVDRHRLVQAVSNVVANAVEISQDGGQVDLAVKQVGDDVEVAVSDTGPGIAPGEVDQIFDRHRWGNDGRRRASVGLGLVISKEYVEAHGGRIRVQNRPGRGSTFTIAIPMHPRGAPETPVHRRASRTSPSS